jgi:signal transduction histidine kinase
MARISLRNRFWMVSIAFVLSAFLLMLFLLTVVLTPPVAKRLVRLDEERRMTQLVQSGDWQAEGLRVTEVADPEFASVPLDDGRYLVSDRPLNVWESIKVVRPSRYRGWFGLVAWAGLLYLLATLLARFVNRPIKELAEGVRALADGERDIQVRVPEEAELAELARGFNDMTAQLAQREQELEEALLAKGRLFASTSHELRTPLTLILGYCQMLEDGLKGELTDEQRASFQVIHRNANGLLSQVEMLLTDSQLRAGSLPLTLEVFDLRDMLDEQVQEMKPLAQEKELSLEIELAEHEVRAEVDSKLATQIVRNLIANAIKFTPQGKVEVKVASDDGLAKVTVKDTGPGVNVAFEERLFQEFTRGPNSEGIEGTGLGLALSQRLASEMGGEVVLADNGPDGATFCWQQPLCEF